MKLLTAVRFRKKFSQWNLHKSFEIFMFFHSLTFLLNSLYVVLNAVCLEDILCKKFFDCNGPLTDMVITIDTYGTNYLNQKRGVNCFEISIAIS